MWNVGSYLIRSIIIDIPVGTENHKFSLRTGDVPVYVRSEYPPNGGQKRYLLNNFLECGEVL
jgi:hypothetical protein